MMAVVDTNVLLAANGAHGELSADCVIACVEQLQALQADGVVVIDDDFRILGEYRHKTRLNPPKGVGDVFLKWLLREAGNLTRVAQVSLTETAADTFVEFPCADLQDAFDAADRKFASVAHAHPDRPPILQAADSKWLDWWPALQARGVHVRFLCATDACRFYARKFPDRAVPELPPGQQ